MTTPDPRPNPYGDQPEPPPYPSPPGGAEPTVPPRPSSPQPSSPEPQRPQSQWPQSPWSQPTWPEQPGSSYPPPGYPPTGYPPPGYGQLPPYGGGAHSGYGVPGYGVPGYDGSGYGAPGYAGPGYGGPGYAGPGWDVPDPLVPHPAGGFNAWWSQIWRAFGRSWRSLALIAVVTSVLPWVVFVIVAAPFADGSYSTVDRPDGGENLIVHWGHLGPLLAIAAVFAIISVFATAAGWSASMWLVVRQAAGAPVSLGAALSYGARRAVRLAGVLVVVGLMSLVGFAFCIVPGIYLATASSLVVPFLLFDRRTSAIGGSFRLVNRNFGAVLGRLVVLYLLLLAAGAVVSVINGGLNGATGGGSTAIEVIGNVLIEVVLGVPATMVTIIAVLVLYAQMRARAIPTTVHDLARALDA